MWTYESSTGNLSHDGELVGDGYSGHSAGLNNPAMEMDQDVGPIPRGEYTIGPFFTDPEKGPLVARLTPNEATNDFGRAGFMLHGDNQSMNDSASLGCIVMAHSIRLQVSESGDTALMVV